VIGGRLEPKTIKNRLSWAKKNYSKKGYNWFWQQEKNPYSAKAKECALAG